MADAGDLEKLPPEIRKEIYTHLLVESEAIPIKRLLRAKRKRLLQGKRKPNKGTIALQSWTGRSSGILRVNKLIGEEAAQVLYGYNKFEFLNAGALRHFLGQIGDAKRHLRHVSIYQDGILFMKSWNSFKQSIQLLASGTSLRTLEVSHSVLCPKGKLKLQIAELVEHCKPLLHALNDDFAKNGLNMNVLDVVKIGLVPSVCELNGTCSMLNLQHPRIFFLTKYTSRMQRVAIPRDQCGCLCGEAGHVNDDLKQELKEEVAKQLKLESS